MENKSLYKNCSEIVLMYHCIYADDPTKSGFQNESAFQYKLNIKMFEEHVKALSAVGKPVIFSFDDGGVSFYQVVAPILEKYHQKGLFFISTKYIGTKGFLTVKQIQDLHLRGHVIASHSHSHPDNIAALKYNEIVEEWKESVRILSKICGILINVASIPNGYSSRKVIEAAKVAGIRILYTSKPTSKGKRKYDVQLVGRYVVHRDMSVSYVKSIVCSQWQRMKLKYRYKSILIVKAILGSYYHQLKLLIIKK